MPKYRIAVTRVVTREDIAYVEVEAHDYDDAAEIAEEETFIEGHQWEQFGEAYSSDLKANRWLSEELEDDE